MTAPAAREPGLLFRAREEHAGALRMWRYTVWAFSRNASAVLGLVLVALVLLIALFAPWIAPFPADATGAMNLSNKFRPPSSNHFFGTDEVGGDIFSRVVIGTRLSLGVGLTITGLAMAIGVPLGIAAGYLGGRTRSVIMRLTDLFLSVPGLVLALAMVAALGPGIGNTIVALALVWWPGYVRLVEAKALTIRNEPYIEAARAVGAGHLRILFTHVLPNCISPIVVKGSMDIGLAILAAASLGFIGLGARPPAPEWGAMIAIGRTEMPTVWWYALFPGLFIFVTVLGFNLFGDGLRDVLDPKSGRNA
jgi:peptide/nickel transport system permease protein